jgi:hypothetical protein
MRHKAMFSVGDYELDQASFAKFDPKKAGVVGSLQPPNTTPGVRKGYIRNVKGKAVSVGQSILKAGKKTAGTLKTGGSKVWQGTTDMAGKGWKGTADMAGKGWKGTADMAGKGWKGTTDMAGKGAKIVSSNPKASALVAGATAITGGGTYLLTRPKRNRR